MTLSRFLTSEPMGLVHGTNEPCVYHHKTRRLHLLMYSDDMLARGRKADVQWFFEQLGKRFSIKPLSYLSKSEMMDHLGMVFFETDAGTHLSMQSYIEGLGGTQQVLTPVVCDRRDGLRVSCPVDIGG